MKMLPALTLTLALLLLLPQTFGDPKAGSVQEQTETASPEPEQTLDQLLETLENSDDPKVLCATIEQRDSASGAITHNGLDLLTVECIRRNGYALQFAGVSPLPIRL